MASKGPIPRSDDRLMELAIDLTRCALDANFCGIAEDLGILKEEFPDVEQRLKSLSEKLVAATPTPARWWEEQLPASS